MKRWQFSSLSDSTYNLQFLCKSRDLYQSIRGRTNIERPPWKLSPNFTSATFHDVWWSFGVFPLTKSRVERKGSKKPCTQTGCSYSSMLMYEEERCILETTRKENGERIKTRMKDDYTGNTNKNINQEEAISWTASSRVWRRESLRFQNERKNSRWWMLWIFIILLRECLKLDTVCDSIICKCSTKWPSNGANYQSSDVAASMGTVWVWMIRGGSSTGGCSFHSLHLAACTYWQHCSSKKQWRGSSWW